MKKRFISLLAIMTMVLLYVSVTSYAEVVDSGICGENVMWTLDDEGTLTISGEGDIKNASKEEVPWYENRDNIKTIKIDGRITNIGNYMFYQCSNVTSIELPDSVISIGYAAFYDCNSLTSIIIPDSVTTIDSSAFGRCSSLTNMILPESIISIGNTVFTRCSHLTSITMPSKIESIGEAMFYECNNLTSINIPESVRNIGRSAFVRCTSLKSITIPNSVTSIGYQAFSCCSSLTSIEIPNSVTSIADGVFIACSSLEEIHFCGSREKWEMLNVDSLSENVRIYTTENIEKITIQEIPSVTYTGVAIEPYIVIEDRETVLTDNEYSIEYKNNINVGTATVTITGTGKENPTTRAKYIGTKTMTFVIQKAVPDDIIVPIGLVAVIGQKLSDIKLPDGWSWTNSEIVLTRVGTIKSDAVYTPIDTDNYTMVSMQLSINVGVSPVIKTSTGFSICFTEKHYRCVVYTAIYDSEDKLIAVKITPLNAEEQTDVDLTEYTNGAYARVFIWTDKYAPLLDNAEVITI